MRKFAVFIMSVLMVGCATKMSDLSPPSKQSYFVLERDLYKTETRGMLDIKWVFGLRKGTYKLVAESSDGFYYEGEGDAVFLLSDDRAQKYLDSGEIAPYHKRYKPQLTCAGGKGGLWLPKENSKEKPSLYYIHFTNGVDADLAGLAPGAASARTGGLSTGDGMIVGTATTSIILSLENEQIVTESFDGIVSSTAILGIIEK